jgi:hypothetical protein
MIIDILLIFLSVCFLMAGLIGCILPIIPGPPLSYIALLLLQSTQFADFSSEFLWITALITIIITVLDYALPAWGTKKWGGSRVGTIGSIVGLILGLFFAPVGIILGPFLGAVVGELLVGRDTNTALRSGIGSFIGFMLGTAMKLTVSIAFIYYYFKELYAGIMS